MLENKNLNPTGYRTTTYSNNSGSSTEDTGGWPVSRDRVSVSPIVHGDFHSPNSYSVETDRIRWLDGTNLYREEYFALWGEILQSGPLMLDSESIGLPPDYVTFNAALSRLNEKVRGTLDLTVDLAEAGETKRMLSSSSKAVNYAMRADWRSIVRGVSGKWLEFVYGWTPLASSLYGAATELQRVADSHASSVSASSSDPFEFSYPVRVAYNGEVRSLNSIRGNHRTSVTVNLNAVNGVDSARWASINPLAIAWELTPYSFVADWFLDIGGYLREMETALRYSKRFISGFVSASSKVEGQLEYDYGRSQGSYPYTQHFHTKGTLDVKLTKFVRTILSDYPAPNPPSFKAELGSRRLLNAAALLGNLIKSEEGIAGKRPYVPKPTRSASGKGRRGAFSGAYAR